MEVLRDRGDRGIGAFMIITLPSEEEGVTVGVERSGIPPPNVLVLVMMLGGEIDADQPEDDRRGRREVWKSNSLRCKGTLALGLCDGRAWRKKDNAHLYRP